MACEWTPTKYPRDIIEVGGPQQQQIQSCIHQRLHTQLLWSGLTFLMGKKYDYPPRFMAYTHWWKAGSWICALDEGHIPSSSPEVPRANHANALRIYLTTTAQNSISWRQKWLMLSHSLYAICSLRMCHNLNYCYHLRFFKCRSSLESLVSSLYNQKNIYTRYG
jgi:hypothetical protein